MWRKRKVLGVSNEVFNKAQRGYVLFLDIDNNRLGMNDIMHVEGLIWRYWDEGAVIITAKTRHGYHFVGTSILTVNPIEYAKVLLEIAERCKYVDTKHIGMFLMEGRSILRISGRYLDKVIPFRVAIPREYKYSTHSKAHLLIYKQLGANIPDWLLEDECVEAWKIVVEKYER